METEHASGAGNKVLLLLAGIGSIYLQHRGLSRWDTCAAEAVAHAKKGLLCMLEPMVTSKATVQYTYLQSDINLDFLTNSANLTPYNARIDVF